MAGGTRINVFRDENAGALHLRLSFKLVSEIAVPASNSRVQHDLFRN